MMTTQLTFTAADHSVDAIQRAAYRLCDRLSIDLVNESGVIQVIIHPVAGQDTALVCHEFRVEVLDQVLRERIRNETADVRNLILAHTFSQMSEDEV